MDFQLRIFFVIYVAFGHIEFQISQLEVDAAVFSGRLLRVHIYEIIQFHTTQERVLNTHCENLTKY